MADRPDWNTYFLEIAKIVATRSTCLRIPAGVGALIVDDYQILSTGYAGSIRGQPHCTQAGCLIDEKTGGCVRTVHAEMNAILQAAQHGARIAGATVYSTMSPCWDCFKACANGGIKHIYYAVEYRTVERQKEFAEKCGIEFKHLGTEKYVPAKPVADTIDMIPRVGASTKLWQCERCHHLEGPHQPDCLMPGCSCKEFVNWKQPRSK